jgi:hypothetical protein
MTSFDGKQDTKSMDVETRATQIGGNSSYPIYQ